MKRILFLSMLLTLLTCCKSEQQNTLKQVSNNLIEVEYQHLPIYNSDTSIIQSIRYIPLETNEKSILGDIGKLLYLNGMFYIHDRKQMSIYQFDKWGNFVKKIGTIGRGPGEYVSIQAFDVDAKGNIYVWDAMSHKLVIYYENAGKFSEFRLKKGFEEFIVAGDNHLIVRNLLDQGMIKSRIASYDFINDETEELLNTGYYYDDFDIIRFGHGFSFFRSENRTFFYARFKNEIFEVSSNAGINKIIQIVDPVPSREFINNLKNGPNIDFTAYQYIINIGDIYENSGIITMTIRKDDIYTLMISKESGNYILFQNLIHERNFFGSWPIRGIAGEEFISVFWPRGQQNEMWQKAVNRSSLEFNQKQILLNRRTGDNPVLVLFKFKDF